VGQKITIEYTFRGETEVGGILNVKNLQFDLKVLLSILYKANKIIFNSVLSIPIIIYLAL